MPISINWGAKIINVSIDSLEFVSTNIYKLDINTFRLALKALEESEDGMAFPDTHRHNTEVDVAGITLARVVEMINDYTITFEDDQYLVTLYGANSNISDVINFNQVSVRAVTSAGLLVSVQGSGVTEQDKSDIATAVHEREVDNDGSSISLRKAMRLFLSVFTGKTWWDEGEKQLGFRDINDTKDRLVVTIEDKNRVQVNTRDGY